MATTKIVKKLALKRETVKSLGVKSGLATGEVQNSLGSTTVRGCSDWTQGPSNNAASAASGMLNSGDSGLHLQGGVVTVLKQLPPP